MSEFSCTMDVESTVDWARKHFGDFVAANIKNEELDGRHLESLARSPDSITLLNRLGMNRIKVILKFQELLGILRPITCNSISAPQPERRVESRRASQHQQQQTSSYNQTHNQQQQQQLTSGQFTLSPLTDSSHSNIQSPPTPSQTIATNNEMVFRAMGNLQQKLIRNEVRKRWPDSDLPTFRRMDTSNIEELDTFVDTISNINALTAMGKDLIRKKVISIIRERRKYVNKLSSDNRSGDANKPPSFVNLDGEEDGDDVYQYQKSEVHSDTEQDAYFEDSEVELNFSNEGPARKRPKNERFQEK